MLYILFNLFNYRPDLNLYFQNTPFYLDTQINNITCNKCISADPERGKFVILKNYHLYISSLFSYLEVK